MEQRFLHHVGGVVPFLVPADDGTPLPFCQRGRGHAEQRGGLSKPAFPQLNLFQMPLGILAGLDAVAAPVGQLPAHGGNGVPALPGDLGTAEQNHIRFPAVLQIQCHQPQHLAPAQRFAQSGLGLLAQNRHIGVSEAGQIDFAGLLFLGLRGRGAPLRCQQSRARPELQSAAGRLHAGQRQRFGQRFGVGLAGLQAVQRHAHRVALRLLQMAENQLRHRHGVALQFCQLVPHAHKPPIYNVISLYHLFPGV